MARIGRVNEIISLQVKFYVNGTLTTPYSVDDVRILTSEGGTVLDIITPTLVSTGIYQANWDVPAISPGTYYDEWTITAESDMESHTRLYSFRIDALSGEMLKTEGGPLFVGHREVDFFNSVAKELIQKVVGQRVTYYAVSEEHTKTHRLYDEAVKKTVHTPVNINALILYNEPVQTSDQFSIDTVYSIEVYFHYHELEERNIIPREGDFVKFGSVVYEIEKLIQPQLVYGQIDNKVMVKANCRVARKQQFEVLT